MARCAFCPVHNSSAGLNIRRSDRGSVHETAVACRMLERWRNAREVPCRLAKRRTAIPPDRGRQPRKIGRHAAALLYSPRCRATSGITPRSVSLLRISFRRLGIGPTTGFPGHEKALLRLGGLGCLPLTSAQCVARGWSVSARFSSPIDGSDPSAGTRKSKRAPGDLRMHHLL
jgi:hypothetical protein